MSIVLTTLQGLQDHTFHAAYDQAVALHQHAAGLLPGDKTPKPKPKPPAGGGDSSNPFTGLKPNFSILGAVFKNKWTTAFAAVWACAIIYVGFKFIPAILAYANHRGNHHPGAQSEALTEVKKTGTAFAGLICLVPIIGVVYAVMN